MTFQLPSNAAQYISADGRPLPDFYRWLKQIDPNASGSGSGLPPGGTTGQVPVKASATDGDAVWHTLVKGDVGLGNVDNTSDANKPVSTAAQTALNLKANTADLGTAAAADTGDFDAAGTATAAIASHVAASDPHPQYLTATEGNAAYQPLDGDLTAIAALTTTAFGRSLLALAAAADLRTSAGLVIGTNLRERLTADRTYYVRTDGSDSNTGLANTSGGAFLTIQKAVDVVAALDCSIYNVTVQVGGGTYTGAVTLKQTLGAGSFVVQGDTTTPSNVLISTTSATCFSASGHPTAWTVTGFKLQTTTSGQCVMATNGAKITIGAVEYGACAGYHNYAANNAGLTFSSNYTISGSSTHHLRVENSSFASFLGGLTTTMSGTLAFAPFVYCQRGSGIIHFSGTFTGGTITGSRYLVQSNGYIETNGGGANYFPGSTAGSTATGGQYV